MLLQAAPPQVEKQTQAAQEERRRLARELHDSVAQLLYGISLQAAAAGRSCRAGNTNQAAQRLADIQQDAQQALTEIRLLICGLDPPLLEESGLGVALQACLKKVERHAGLQTELVIAGVERLPQAMESELYRLTVEALSNLVRHAQANRVKLQLLRELDTIRLQIDDDGVGFDPPTACNSGGMGLQNIAERARQLGGRLEIDSAPGRGTRITVTVKEAG